MLKESKADIFVDPVLHTACALDLKHHCAAITPGRGRREYTTDCVRRTFLGSNYFMLKFKKINMVLLWHCFKESILVFIF